MNDEQLNQYREEGTKIRIVRDALEQNDVIGTVVAWDDEHVLIRRPNRRVIKVKRGYTVQLASEQRPSME
jgi:hypothetical protein